MTPEQLEEHRLYRGADGRFYRVGDGGRPFDTRNAETGGQALFVMDRDGNLYVTNRALSDELYHSSFLGGEVGNAGETLFVDGVPIRFTRKSGGYQPTPEHERQLIKVLDELGVDVSRIAFVLGY